MLAHTLASVQKRVVNVDLSSFQSHLSHHPSPKCDCQDTWRAQGRQSRAEATLAKALTTVYIWVSFPTAPQHGKSSTGRRQLRHPGVRNPERSHRAQTSLRHGKEKSAANQPGIPAVSRPALPPRQLAGGHGWGAPELGSPRAGPVHQCLHTALPSEVSTRLPQIRLFNKGGREFTSHFRRNVRAFHKCLSLSAVFCLGRL